MDVRKAYPADAERIAALACRMWDHDLGEMTEEFRGIIEGGKGAVFLAVEEGKIVGFAQCQLRHDYVEGTETSPVGYLEGVYVEEAFRRRGCAARLLSACEDWAREQGCEEFASDCELTNADSLRFHLALGFTEANRIICFTKSLK